jgi:tRNA modification GTPase
MDLSQAEAVMDVISARSERALSAANRQLRGSLGKHMNALTDRLLNVVARVEAYIDFPEDDLPPEDHAFFSRELTILSNDTDRLLATSRYADLLRDGVKTVIVGAPNVGKSSLLNRLVGRERALVSSEPGTTRDFIEERILVGPHCLRIIDTAGLNPIPAPLEKLGMDKTLECISEADLLLLVLDGSDPNSMVPSELADRCIGEKSIIIFNKSDLYDKRLASLKHPSARAIVDISAVTGSGLDELTSLITRHADRFKGDFDDDFVAINARHSGALQNARNQLASARDKLAAGQAFELLASDLRDALSSYGEIIGKIDNEAMLDRLFSTFCIGK